MSLEIRAGFVRRQTALKNTIAEIKSHEANIKKKLAISASLGSASFGISWGVIPAFAVRESAMIGDLTEGALKAGLALGLGYGIHITSFLVNLNQNRRLLQNENIETSPNFPATVIYHGLGKIESLKEQRGKRSFAAVSAPTIASWVTSAILRESAFLSYATLSPDKMREIVLLKSAQGVFNLIQAGLAEAVLRTKGREKKRPQSLSANGVVFEQPEVKNKV